MRTLGTFEIAAAIAAFTTGAGLAQTSGASPEGPTGIAGRDGAVRRFPGTFGAQSAIPSPGGTGYVGLNYANPRGGVSGAGADGDAGAGYTFGNPVDAVSLTFGLSVTSLDRFGDSGALSLSVARVIGIGDRSLTFLGASASNLAAWGDAAAAPEGYTIQISHLLAIPTRRGERPVQVTAGHGNRTTVEDDGSGRIRAGGFVGLGVGVSEHLSLGVSATGTQLNAGLSLGLPDVPALSISLGVFDVTDNVDRRQVSLGVSFGF
ncbi:hypothetical protein HKCCE3408_00065 [Rhodobacterales bacterium HKCCE3408]|nr:hypothetical protein [Rhodobacterales bacterium HKCCE3408]